MAAPAASGAESISGAIDTPKPEQYNPLALTVSGTSNGSSVFVHIRPASVPCQNSYLADYMAESRGASPFYVDPLTGTAPSELGPFTISTDGISTINDAPQSAGPWLMCMWLGGFVGASGGASASLPFTVLPPQVTLSPTFTPRPDGRGDYSITTISSQFFEPILGFLVQAASIPCAPTPELDRIALADHPNGLLNIGFDVLRGKVPQGTLTKSMTAYEPPGSYLICAWVEAADHSVLAAASTLATFNANSGASTKTQTPLTALRISPSVLHAASHGPSLSKRRTTDTAKVSFRLSRPSTVTFAIERLTSGRRARGGECEPQTDRNRRAPRCNWFSKLQGRFRRHAHAGLNTLYFTGRFAGKQLTPGRYRLLAIPSHGDVFGTTAESAFRVLP